MEQLLATACVMCSLAFVSTQAHTQANDDQTCRKCIYFRCRPKSKKTMNDTIQFQPPNASAASGNRGTYGFKCLLHDGLFIIYHLCSNPKKTNWYLYSYFHSSEHSLIYRTKKFAAVAPYANFSRSTNQSLFLPAESL
jgi:hypothetical protein